MALAWFQYLLVPGCCWLFSDCLSGYLILACSVYPVLCNPDLWLCYIADLISPIRDLGSVSVLIYPAVIKDRLVRVLLYCCLRAGLHRP